MSAQWLPRKSKDEYLEARFRMDADYVPTMGRGSILQTYHNRHRVDESLNKQLRTTLGVGYSNEATENFWRGEQEENEPLDKLPEGVTPSSEVNELVPTTESLSFLSPVSDIIYVSPGNTIGPKKPTASPKKCGESRGTECNKIGPLSTRKSPQHTPLTSMPIEKSTKSLGITFVSPANMSGPSSTRKSPEHAPVTSVLSPGNETLTSAQDSSPKKKKKTAANRKNRNALLNILAIQKGAERETTPGMPPDALTYVDLGTSEKSVEQNHFHYKKDEFPPLC